MDRRGGPPVPYGGYYGAQSAMAGPSRGGGGGGSGTSFSDQRGGRGRGRGRGRGGRGHASTPGQGFHNGAAAYSTTFSERPTDNGYAQRRQYGSGVSDYKNGSYNHIQQQYGQNSSEFRPSPSGPSAGSRQQNGRSYGGPAPAPERGIHGHLICGHNLGDGQTCSWRSGSELSMTLHRADRHLVYPEGGPDVLARIDPLLAEERREKMRRAKKRSLDDDAEEQSNSLIPGLNIKLDTPELISKWIEERKKRWPSQAAVEKKRALTWADASTAKRRERPPGTEASSAREDAQAQTHGRQTLLEEKDVETDESSSDASSDESTSSSDDDSSGSDVDEERDAISSKVAPTEPTPQVTGECRFFSRGRCRDGDACKFRHDVDSAKLPLVTRQEASKKRRRPRAASPNPFDAPHLLRALLRNEIAQHVNYVAQVARFLVRNNFLKDFERKAGDAERQKKQRSLVQVISVEESTAAETDNTSSELVSSDAQAPLVDGALPIVGTGLYEPRSPTLQPLEQLSLPPEPDEFLLMDPLRAQDARPLTHQQYRDLAQDDGIRALLVEEPKGGQAHMSSANTLAKGMVRALQTLDALPTYAHRASAIEQILGVSEQSAHHAHQLGPTYIRPDRTSSSIGTAGGSSVTASASSLAGQAGGPARVIGENELFRLGLRVGPVEIQRLRQLAGRISALIGGPEFAEEAGDIQGRHTDADAAIRPWYDEATRHELRKQQWARQGEWRDQMRKLGIEVD